MKRIQLPARVIELQSAEIYLDKIPRARIRVTGATDCSRDLTIMNLVGLKLDEKIQVTIESEHDA